MSVEAKSRSYVLEKELDRIRVRRNVAYQKNKGCAPGSESSESPSGNDTTGLALSGGGVRSAAFSLGFLQGLYHAGRMKGFDYLSTVSGGGYAGAFFSTQVVEQDKVDWEKDGKHDRLSLEPNRDGTPSETVARLGMHGRMMGNFLELFSRHLWGFIVNVVFTISGVVAIAALLAYFMRTAWNPSTIEGGWTPGAMTVTSQLGFRTDMTRPFFFAFIALCIWLLSHAFNKTAKILGKRPVAITRYTYLLLVASVVLGFLTLLAIGDVGMTSWIDDFDLDPSISGRINTVIHWMATGLSAVFAAMLLPYLSPKRLLQSGQASAGNVKSLIFRLAGNAVLIGVPLFLFFFLAHENISGQTTNRLNVDQMVPSHLRLISQWAPVLESQTLDQSPVKKALGNRILAALNGDKDRQRFKTDDDQMPDRKNSLKSYLKFDSEKKAANSELNLARRWVHYFESYFHSKCAFEERMSRQREIRIASELMVKQLNQRCLSDPGLFVTLPKLPPVKTPQPATEANSNATRLRASVNRRWTARVDDHVLFTRLASLETRSPIKVRDFNYPRTRNEPTVARDVNADTTVESNATNEELLVALGLIATASDIRNEVPSQRRKDLLKAMGDLRVGKQLLEKRFPTEITTNFSDLDSGSTYLGLCYRALDEVLGLRDLDPQESSKREDGTRILRRNEFDGTALTALETFFDDESSAYASVVNEREKPGVQRKDTELSREKFKSWFMKESVAINDDLAAIRKNNWLLLNAVYPDHVRPQNTTFASVVNVADQAQRLQIAAWALFIFLAVGLLSNLNSTSLHGVYRDQLARIWTPDDSMKLSELDTCSKGAPYQLINATVNRMGNRNDPDPEGQSRFLMSELYCGTHKLGYRETNDYQEDEIAVADAVAISGAALTTITTGNFLQQMILFLTNCRLGQWLRNPINHRVDRYWPSPIRALGSLLWYPDQRSFLFVSDGGHLDNTGIAALLERRCRLIVCLDGSFDPKGEFADLLKVLHSARGKYGMTVRPLSTGADEESAQVCHVLDVLRAETKEGNATFSKKHFVTFYIEYPEKDEHGNPVRAVLVYCKLSVSGDEPLELTEMARAEKTFPHDPTSDQFLPANVFEAYTALGRHIAEQVDRFFEQQPLEQYELPLCWSGKASNEESDELHDSLDHDESVDDAVETNEPDHNEFAEKQFNRVGIKSAIAGLQTWCDNELSHPEEALDDDYLCAMSQWAREKGTEAKQPLRKMLCIALSDLVDSHADKLTAHPSIRLELYNILSMLGDGVPEASIAMKKLAAAQVAPHTKNSEKESEIGETLET